MKQVRFVSVSEDEKNLNVYKVIFQIKLKNYFQLSKRIKFKLSHGKSFIQRLVINM